MVVAVVGHGNISLLYVVNVSQQRYGKHVLQHANVPLKEQKDQSIVSFTHARVLATTRRRLRGRQAERWYLESNRLSAPCSMLDDLPGRPLARRKPPLGLQPRQLSASISSCSQVKGRAPPLLTPSTSLHLCARSNRAQGFLLCLL